MWTINPQANYEFPFGIIIPQSELRAAQWSQHRNKGTIWLPVASGKAIEVAVFLIRTTQDQSNSLAAEGWHTTIVNASLPDGRRLFVVAGNSLAHVERQKELQNIRMQVGAYLRSLPNQPQNPRILLFATGPTGTRRFVEVAI